MEKNSRLKIENKKDQVSEIAFILFTVASICICLIIAAYVYTNVGNELNGGDISTNESTAAYGKFAAAWPILDGSIIFVVLGLTIGLVVTSFLIPTHPVFFVINLVGFMVLVFIGAVYSNTYTELVNTDATMYNVTTQYFAKSGYVINHLPYIAAGLVLIASLVMYAKGKNDGNW
jgi:hypothetical protein